MVVAASGVQEELGAIDVEIADDHDHGATAAGPSAASKREAAAASSATAMHRWLSHAGGGGGGGGAGGAGGGASPWARGASSEGVFAAAPFAPEERIALAVPSCTSEH